MVLIWFACRTLKRQTITSATPLGWAAGDHSQKYGLRSKRTVSGVAETMRYGPVPGTGTSALSFNGVSGGTGAADGNPSQVRRSGSGLLSRNSIVPRASSVTMAPASEQVPGSG